MTGGDPPGSELDDLRQHYPGWIDALLEDERARRPEAVAALRSSMGLDPDPWREMVGQAIALYAAATDPAERVTLAASLLVGDGDGLSALIMALCHHPEGGPLLAAAHAVARTNEQRRILSGYLVRRRRGVTGIDDPGFYLNRDTPAFHTAFLEGDLLAIVFREYPGRYAVFAMQLGEGVEDLVVRPVADEAALAAVLQAQTPGARTPLSVDDCRAHLGAAIASLRDRKASTAWRALGHLVEERLFPCEEESPGFVVGEVDARLFLDRIAQIVVEGDYSLITEVIFPGSAAEVLVDLVGYEGLTVPLGIASGVARLEIVFETGSHTEATAILVGRSATDVALTCTRFHLCSAQDMWWLYELEAMGVGPGDRMLGDVWRALCGPNHLPLQVFDELPEYEQELVVGLLDDGYRLDEIAAVLQMGRTLELDSEPGSVAAACHLAWARLCGEPAFAANLIERYDAEEAEVDRLLAKLPSPPEPLQFSAR